MLLALVLPVFVDSGGGGFYPVAIDGVKLRRIHHDGAYLVMICEIGIEGLPRRNRRFLLFRRTGRDRTGWG